MLMELLTWAVPSGCLASLATWLVNRGLYNVRSLREKEEIYKELYEDVGASLLTLQNDYGKLFKEFSAVKRAVMRSASCRYYDTCPVRRELQDKPDKQFAVRQKGQHGNQGSANRHYRSRPREPDGIETDGGKPP